jgi:2-polyprenyl-3-methyl-5-hydroxy-6-metoxy-1,4-benzoquinol methylase
MYLNYLKKTAELNYINNIIENLSSLNLEVENFLDLGCSDGVTTFKVAEAVNSKNILGIDGDLQALKIFLKILNKKNLLHKKVTLKKLNLEKKNWNLKKNYYDFIFANQVIEHMYDVDNFVKNIKNSLKKNSFLLISTENLACLHNVLSLILGYQPFSLANMSTKKWTIGNPFSRIEGHNSNFMKHRAVFTVAALEEFLKLHNFKIIKKIVAGYFPLPNNFIGNFFSKIDPRRANYIAILCKK